MLPSKTTEPQRIAKLLARAGIASRREVERMIDAGRIAIDGKPIETPATLLKSLKGVTVDGKPVKAAPPARLFLYHKPVGQLVTEHDPKGRPTIYDKLPDDLPRLMPVGRLDYNTEGLLLLTTDGELKRALELPSNGVERVYRARAHGEVTQAQLEELIHGVEIDGVRYGSIDANMERRTGTNVWIEMKLSEGKNREVRRVLEYLGLQVNRLIRLAYGPFVLGTLGSGEIGEIRQHDLVSFRKDMALTGSGREADRGASKPAVRPLRSGSASPDRARPKADAGGKSTGRPRKPGKASPARPGGRPAAEGEKRRGARPAAPTAQKRPDRSESPRKPRSAESKPDDGLRKPSDARKPGRPGARPHRHGGKPGKPRA